MQVPESSRASPTDAWKLVFHWQVSVTSDTSPTTSLLGGWETRTKYLGSVQRILPVRWRG